MNYIKELNAFKDWLLIHHISTSAISVWLALMMINNACGWKKSFQAPNQTVEVLSKLSKQGVSNARAQLVEHGLIVYQPGRIGQAATYEMVSLVKSVDQVLDQSVVQTLDQSVDNYHFVDQSLDQDLTILKQEEERSRSRREASVENPFSIYEENFGVLRPFLMDSLIKWCDELGDEIIIAGIKLAVKKGGRTYSYIEEIWKEWASAKLKTLDQVQAYESQKQAQKTNLVPFRSQSMSSHQALIEKLKREG